jgi:hypothetical protein
MATLFVSTSKLKRDTALGGSVDDNIIRPYIKVAQDKFILPILGTELYQKLATDVQNATPLTGRYLDVMNLIQPALTFHAFAEVAYVMRLRFANNSVTQVQDDTGSSASTQDIKLVVDNARNIAEFYTKRLSDYLCAFGTEIPEYLSNQWPDVYPNHRPYFSGLNIGRSPLYERRIQQYLSAINVRL